ncbi:SRPBCC family protein [Robiginitalea sp. IMCC44478]|uniref:SRPBCC family protein n=1 Tax=Robiginitalea sp. IMCC44478 TaxID=3459122 RepID=UPI0040423B0A
MTALYIVIGVLVIITALYLIAPSKYDISRTIEISRPAAEVFEYLKFLKNQDEWSPWARKDPNMKKELKGEDGSVGAISFWEGNREVGSGEQEITAVHPDRRVETELRFLKPFKSVSDAYMEVEALEKESTQVRWGFTGTNGFPMRLMMLFMSMDKMVGKDFEEGLSNLKRQLEKGS